jgi:tetratricopeptide (TPR) repeat protein
MHRSRRRIATLVVASALAIPMLSACGDDESPAVKTAGTLQEALADQLAGRDDEAAAAYTGILKEDPSNKVALYNLGLLAQNEGDLVEAEAKYRAALAADAAYTPALFNLAIIRTSQGGAEGKKEAIELYRKVIAATPDDAGSHLNLGFLVLEAGDDATAQREFATAVRLQPDLAQRISPDQSPLGKGSSTASTAPSPSPSA